MSETPSQKDLFDGQAHEKVASAITSLLEDPDLVSGRIVGLEGAWGSGKSTIVGLVVTKVDPGKTVTVMFDSWAHQADPLRRAFLETVITTMAKLGHLSENLADGFRNQLSGKATKVITNSSAFLSKEGLIVSLSSLLMPLGVHLSSIKTTTWQGSYRVLGNILLVAPLLVIIAMLGFQKVGKYLVKRSEINEKGLENSRGSVWRKRLSELEPLSFFAKSQKINTTALGVERGEPTSLEFEKLFKEIVEASTLDSRQLLIILDNLDRVDVEVARQLFATMQTFIEISRTWNPSHHTKIWLLIPYDPQGLDLLWNPVELGNDTSDENTLPLPFTTPVSVAFIEKLFNVRFEAPPLVVSDWHKRLRELLAEALPGHAEDEFDEVRKLRVRYVQFQSRSVVSREAPTPRQLKNFVNQIGIIRRLTNTVPLPQVAYYVLLRQDRINVAEMLLGSPPRNSKVEAPLGQDLATNLLALHFGTDPKLAQQLFISPRLIGAFGEGSVDGIVNLKTMPGFIEVVENLDVDDMILAGGSELMRNLGTLYSAKVFESPELGKWLEKDVSRIARKVSSWTLDGSASGVGLALIFSKLKPDGPSLADLIAKISPISVNPNPVESEAYFLGFVGFLSAMTHDFFPNDLFEVPIQFPTVNLVLHVSRLLELVSDTTDLSRVQIQNTPEEIARALVDSLQDDQIQGLETALRWLLNLGGKIDLAVLQLGLTQALDARAIDSKDKIVSSIKLMEEVSLETNTDQFLRPLAESGALLHLTSVTSGNDFFDLMAKVTLLHLIATPSMTETVLCGDSRSGKQILEQVLLYPANNTQVIAEQSLWLSEHSDKAFLILQSVRPYFPLWVSSLMHDLARLSSLVISADQYLSHLEYLRSEFIPSELDSISRHLFVMQTSRLYIMSNSSDIELAISALRISQSEPDIGLEIREWAKEIVLGLKATDWEVALLNPEGAPLLTLAVLLADTDESPLNPTGLPSALHLHFDRLAEGSAVWHPAPEIFVKITSLLPSASRQVIAQELCSKLQPLDGEVPSELLLTYQIFLGSEKKFRTHLALPHLIERAVSKQQWGTVQWIVELADRYKDTLQTSRGSDGMEHLKVTVKEKLGEFQDPQASPPECLLALAKKLGL
ncbi:MAG TPA: P-loop NTPase fold protein [Candidatus Paceibacterota bacterium]|nr:P-loop NTPase fold protein [Candidatus Paceibacterota bacterium]